MSEKLELLAVVNLASVLGDLNRYAEAKEQAERGLAIAREAGNRRGEILAARNLGSVFSDLGRYEEAQHHHEQALATAREIGARAEEGSAMRSLGAILHARGCDERARDHLEQGLAIAREIGDRRGEAMATLHLGKIFDDAGDEEKAHDCFTKCLGMGRELCADGVVVLAACCLASLPEGSASEVISIVKERKNRLDCGTMIVSQLTLWKATGKHEHLAEAKRLLDYRIEHAPEEYRESMLKNVRLNREIMAAWAEHGENVVGEGDGD